MVEPRDASAAFLILDKTRSTGRAGDTTSCMLRTSENAPSRQ
jgi:hypothetical protein